MAELMRLEMLRDRVNKRLKEIDLVLNLKHDEKLSNEYNILSIKLNKVDEKILECRDRIIYKTYI